MPQLRPSLRSALIAVVVVLQAFLPLVDALPAPVRLPSLPPVASAATGAAWAWGRNNLGQLGDGSTAQRTSPVQVSGLDGVTALAGGGEHTLALKSDGTVWAWGDNATGQLGDGSTTQRTSPVQVSGLTAVTAIAAGNDHSLALKDDGTVWA
jgi:alpha-tubulin suppressor-like RCC1 family protein